MIRVTRTSGYGDKEFSLRNGDILLINDDIMVMVISTNERDRYGNTRDRCMLMNLHSLTLRNCGVAVKRKISSESLRSALNLCDSDKVVVLKKDKYSMIISED